MIYGSIITLLILILAFNQKNFVWVPSTHTELFYISKIGAVKNIISLQRYIMTKIFPNGNPVLVVFTILDNLLYTSSQLEWFKITSLATSCPIFVWFTETICKVHFSSNWTLQTLKKVIFNSRTYGSQVKNDTVLEILEYEVYFPRIRWFTAINPTNRSSAKIKDTTLTKTSSNIKDSLGFCSILWISTSWEPLAR